MRRRSVPLRAAGVAAVATLTAIAACESPTEVTLVLTTDVDCATLKGTTITVGTADGLEDKDFVADTGSCSPGAPGASGNSIGTFVVVPSGSRSAAFAVRVVSGVDHVAHDCAPGGQPPDYTGCIVARRELTFIPHTPLTLPIEMHKECENVVCGIDQTCVAGGHCVSSMIPSPAACAAGGCSEATLLDGGVVAGADASQSPDAMVTDGPPVEASGLDAPFDGQPATDAPVSDGPWLDGPPADAATIDAAGADAREADSGVTDAPGIDAPGPDATVADAAPASDGSPMDASPPQEASSSADAGILGNCVSAGTPHGVTCGGSTCATGDVCCVAQPTAGGLPTSSCSAPTACDTSATGAIAYSSLVCRNRGDCPAGNVCCLETSTVAYSFSTTCTASCPINTGHAPACSNSCECTASTCQLASPCTGLSLATCGGTCL